MAPIWQSWALLIAALLATGAVEVASAAYAFQSASRAQVLDLGGVAIQTDVLLKTLMSIAAGLAVVIGPSVAIYKLSKQGERTRRQGYLAVAVCVVGFWLAAGNLSGYFAWTRDQRAVEVAQDNPLYDMAAANAARVARGEAAYLTGDDRRILREGQAQITARREAGDVARAAFILALISGMATAYRLPKGASLKREGNGRRRGRRSRRAAAGNVTQLRAAKV